MGQAVAAWLCAGSFTVACGIAVTHFLLMALQIAEDLHLPQGAWASTLRACLPFLTSVDRPACLAAWDVKVTNAGEELVGLRAAGKARSQDASG